MIGKFYLLLCAIYFDWPQGGIGYRHWGGEDIQDSFVLEISLEGGQTTLPLHLTLRQRFLFQIR
jgi:hypothetical protein